MPASYHSRTFRLIQQFQFLSYMVADSTMNHPQLYQWVVLTPGLPHDYGDGGGSSSSIPQQSIITSADLPRLTLTILGFQDSLISTCVCEKVKCFG